MTVRPIVQMPAPQDQAQTRVQAYVNAFRVLAPIVFLGVVPLVIWPLIVVSLAHHGILAYDFHHFFGPHARDLMHGRTISTAYPPVATLFYVPFAVLPAGVGDVVVAVAAMGCAMATLWILDVRDWRCYGLTALLPSVYGSVQTGNLTLFLTVALALVWRWRARPVACGVLVAAVLALKLFLWPVLIWLVATRRWPAVMYAGVVGVAASLVGWLVVGFGALSDFPTLLRQNIDVNGSAPYTIAALVRQLGGPSPVGYALCWALGGVVLAGVVLLARRRRDDSAFILAIGASILLSPIVWAHYLGVLLVPLAIARPRLSSLWFVPLLLAVCPEVDAGIAQKILLLGCGAMTFAVAADVWRPRSPREAHPIPVAT